MLSLRSFSRSAPRSIARLSTLSARQPTRILRSSLFAQAQWRQAPTIKPIAAFHTSIRRCQEADDAGVHEELAAKLAQELELEKDARDPSEAYPGNIQEYLDNSPFELHDTLGQQETHLTRKFGDETIKVTFSIADFGAQSEDEDPDRALFDEDEVADPIEDGQSGGANTKGAINQGRQGDGNVRVAPEDRVAPADRPELSDEQQGEEPEESFPCRLLVTISKPNKGALVIEAATQDGDTVINDLAYFQTTEAAEAALAGKAKEGGGAYTGPPFGNLDEDLQILTERYLEERGINTSLALFVPEFIDFKEQREYVNWLESVKKFVE